MRNIVNDTKKNFNETMQDLYGSHKTRFGETEASKERCKRIYATVSLEDANLKFLSSLPSVASSATMILGQPGLDELNIDDLYNNLKGSTLKQSTAEPAHIPKGYTQAASSKHPYLTTHDDEDLLQIDEDAMEEIDIRWQVAMITARIRKFMRKTGRPIDLKPKNGITFDKTRLNVFLMSKVGHFSRECRFAKYQENSKNGRPGKDCAMKIQTQKLMQQTTMKNIEWDQEF
ncbi:hypothetical protein Tco_0822326 [Tanacetum coccineum]|uniref:Uncharacterized protein n=1 Tax=Tanacetum coccineum TaxID=301880 RepID=A0ABQ5AHD9_9ASTR